VGKIRWTPEAFDWLKNAHDYIAKDKPDTAKKIVQGIIKKIELLSQFPEVGYRITDPVQKNLRALLYGHYRIVYQINDDEDVNLIGIFHGALDLKKRLNMD